MEQRASTSGRASLGASTSKQKSASKAKSLPPPSQSASVSSMTTKKRKKKQSSDSQKRSKPRQNTPSPANSALTDLTSDLPILLPQDAQAHRPSMSASLPRADAAPAPTIALEPPRTKVEAKCVRLPADARRSQTPDHYDRPREPIAAASAVTTVDVDPRPIWRRRYSTSSSDRLADMSPHRCQATSVNISSKPTTDVERPTAVDRPTASECPIAVDRAINVDRATDVDHPVGQADAEAPRREAKSTATTSRRRKRRRRSSTSSDSSKVASSSPKHHKHRTTSKRRAQDPSSLSASADRADTGLSAASTTQKGAHSHRPAPILLQPPTSPPLHQHQESPTSMDELPPELSDESDFVGDTDSYCSEASSSHILPAPKTDMLGSQPPSPSEDMKLYSQTIHKIASVMELQVQQDQTADSCKFFGHLNKHQTAPLRLTFIPFLLDRIKEAWAKPSSAPLMSRRVDNMYCTHGEGTSFLDKHPLPNSLVVDATQKRTKGRWALTPSNKEGRKLDIIGRRHYSLASFSLRSAKYLCTMEAYSCHILLQAAPVLDSLPEEQKAKITALHEGLLSLIDYETLAARNMADAAAKQLSTAIYPRRRVAPHDQYPGRRQKQDRGLRIQWRRPIRYHY
ncbi:hypothetical protein JRQ81_019993 [Phrynocephalus forsythii]|uniref:Uncharacterized protein n=1 Tax=Phrynocephalus forsythii TaxID=171643 RepID=A0A9Q1AZ21_9SAUR|nr:hypothetical protein JRQ81_019993 [Phrynocephalus forsythii]